MADTTITVSDISLNTALADPAGTAIVAANTHVITPTKPWRRLLVRVTPTTAAAKDITIAAGDSPPAESAGQGALVTSFADGSVTPVIKWFVLESARFAQSDGTVHITVASGTTGTISAFQMP